MGDHSKNDCQEVIFSRAVRFLPNFLTDCSKESKGNFCWPRPGQI